MDRIARVTRFLGGTWSVLQRARVFTAFKFSDSENLVILNSVESVDHSKSKTTGLTGGLLSGVPSVVD